MNRTENYHLEWSFEEVTVGTVTFIFYIGNLPNYKVFNPVILCVTYVKGV